MKQKKRDKGPYRTLNPWGKCFLTSESRQEGCRESYKKEACRTEKNNVWRSEQKDQTGG